MTYLSRVAVQNLVVTFAALEMELLCPVPLVTSLSGNKEAFGLKSCGLLRDQTLYNQSLNLPSR
jgi:hypothetical protein